jgi:hypothetical protein
MANLLGRAAILAAQDMGTEDIEVPEWGGSVRIKTLTGAERDEWEQSVTVGKGRNREVAIANLRAKLLVIVIVDENGKAVFDYSDIQALGKKSAKALERVFDAARKLNGLTDEDVEELAKNSVTTPAGGSISS